MVIIGGIGFYIHSVVVVIIACTGDAHVNCALALFGSYPVHFLGYLTLVFRAKRIFKVIRLEKKYINQIYSMTKKVKAADSEGTSARQSSVWSKTGESPEPN